MAQIQTALVLQGGGALGAYEYGVLKRLYEERDFRPDVVSGVSIGAINAAALVGARKDPIETLGKLWERFTIEPPLPSSEYTQRFLAMFGIPGFYRMRDDYTNAATWTSFYDTSPLRATLEEFLDFDKIRRAPTKLFLTATNVVTGGIEYFDNAVITPDHVLASGALPPGFPMIRIGHDMYWDGGLFDNSPLSRVIEFLDPDPQVQKQIIVMNLFSGPGPVPRDMLQVIGRVFEILFSNKFQYTVKETIKINDYIDVVNDIDRHVPADDPVRRRPAFKRLISYKMIDDIIYIENRNREPVYAPSDFSRESIEARIDAGYRDAGEKLGEQPKRNLIEGMLRAPALVDAGR